MPRMNYRASWDLEQATESTESALKPAIPAKKSDSDWHQNWSQNW